MKIKFKHLAIAYLVCILILGLAGEYVTLFQPLEIPNLLLNTLMVLEFLSYIVLVWIVVRVAKLFDNMEAKQ